MNDAELIRGFNLMKHITYRNGAVHQHKEINITINGNITSQSISELVSSFTHEVMDTDFEEAPPLSIVDDLMPLFGGSRAEAERFVRKVDGARPTDITQTVNDLLREDKILRSSCRIRLWRILHDNGIYDPTVQNWRRQVNA